MRVYENYVAENGDLDSVKISKVLLNNIDARKKISRVMVKQEDIKYLVDLARAINSQNEYSVALMDYRFDEIIFPKCLSFLIHPSKISMVSNLRAKDLLYHCDSVLKEDFHYDSQRASVITNQIYGSQRNGGEFANVATLREAKLLNDVKWMTYDSDNAIWVTNSEDGVFKWLYPIKGMVDPFGLYYFNDNAEFVNYEFLARWGVDM